MKNIKKTALILAAVMGLSSLAGCGKEKVGGGLTEVRIWTGDTGSRTQYEALVDEFNATIGKEEGIEVIYEAKENLGDALLVALQTGQAPEMFMGGGADEYSEQGYIVAIDDLPGGPELVEKHKQFLIEGKQMYKGKTYSIPYGAQTYGLIYNKDMFKEAGIVDENGEPTPPKTYKEVREYAKRLTDVKNNKYGIVLPLKWSGWFGVDVNTMSVVNMGHIGYDYATGKYDYSGMKPMMDLLTGIKEDKSYMPGAEGLDNDPARARFAEGNIGMKFAVAWDVAVFNDQFVAKCDWDVAPLPVADENNRYAQYLNINTGLKISKNGVDKVGADKIMKVYEWYVSEDTQRKLYEEGVALPIWESATEGVDKSKFKKGWAGFADVIEISKVYPASPTTDISGETKLETNFLNNVWTGTMTADEAIENEEKIQTAGLEKYKSLHPEYDAEAFIIPDWNAKIN